MDLVLKAQETSIDKRQLRKKLLPLWIKIFGWLFIVMAAAVPFLYVSSIVFDFSATYSMFSLEYEGHALAPMPLLISILILINGVCAYGLLLGKDWGLTACIIYGYVGLVLTLGSLVVGLFSGTGITIRLEPIIQIPYLMKLHKLKALW